MACRITFQATFIPEQKRSNSFGNGSGLFASYMVKITRKTTLAEILNYPETEKILAKYNLPCLTCPMAKFEIENLKIGDVCKIYNLDCKKILKELNETLKK